MISPRQFRILCIVLLATVASAAAQMVASNDLVRVEARLSADTDRKDLKKTLTDQVTQNHSLTIQLSGKGRSPETRVVKWTAYARNLESNTLQVIASGNEKLALDGRGTQTITTRTFSSTYTPEHAVTANRGGGKRRNKLPRSKNVDADGVKFAGYAVRVLDGRQVVGTKSDPVGIGDSTERN